MEWPFRTFSLQILAYSGSIVKNTVVKVNQKMKWCKTAKEPVRLSLNLHFLFIELQKSDYMEYAGRQYYLGDKCQVSSFFKESVICFSEIVVLVINMSSTKLIYKMLGFF